MDKIMQSSDHEPFHRRLVDVAMGRKAADVVISDGRWVCVQSGEIIPHTDIAISGEHIAYIGPDASHTIGEGTLKIEAGNRFLVPGLLDGHMHVESGMLTVTEFVRAVVPHGTTAMFIDPHEIANVLGLRGVRMIVDEAAQQPIHVWVEVPSCVPSAPGFETPGAALGPAEISEALSWPGVIGLGEMMNFPGVYNGDASVHAVLEESRLSGKVIGGHYASPDLGMPFHGYVAGGARDDHEGTTMEDAAQRVRQGMKAMLRQGSAWQDVAEGVRAITELGLNPRSFILCTDDSHCQTLVDEGHVNRAVQQAIKHGIDPVTAIQMATINTAEHFGLSSQIGMLAPGRFADILLVSDLEKLRPDMVIAKGRVLAQDGHMVVDLPVFPAPDWAKNSIHIPRQMEAKDFRLTFQTSERQEPGYVRAHIIGIIENQAPTKHLILEMPIRRGEVQPNLAQDLAKVAVIERHHSSGRIQVGLVQGFGFNISCAVASTVAHDCHHIVIVGTDDENLAIAANRLVAIGGGQVVICNGAVIGEVALPIAGLMSNARAATVARQAASVLDGFRACGCALNNPNMQLSLLALVVIPELRISDLGLFDAQHFKHIPVLEPIE